MTEAPKRVIGRPFPKGKSGCPGGVSAKSIQVGLARKMTQTQFMDLTLKYLDKTREELKAMIENPATPVLEVMIAQIIAKGIIEGDQTRLTFLLDRIIGKVPDKIEHSVNNNTDHLYEEFERLNAESKKLDQLPSIGASGRDITPKDPESV